MPTVPATLRCPPRPDLPVDGRWARYRPGTWWNHVRPGHSSHNPASQWIWALDLRQSQPAVGSCGVSGARRGFLRISLDGVAQACGRPARAGGGGRPAGLRGIPQSAGRSGAVHGRHTHTPCKTPHRCRRLLKSVAGALASGGRFVATFRDYRQLPMGDARFIPVRSDDRRIHTCFLEERGKQVIVHDLIYERAQPDASWQVRVSSYPSCALRRKPCWQRLKRSAYVVISGLGPAECCRQWRRHKSQRSLPPELARRDVRKPPFAAVGLWPGP